MARIALSMIARNETDTLRACLESVAPHVDEIVFVDTGSDDDTVEIAREFTDKVFHFEWNDDFAAARQFALEQVSEDCDWFVWVDADDVVEGAEKWRELAEKAAAPIDGFIFPYDYAQDPQTGRTLTTLWRERLLRNPSGWKWSMSVHEVLLRKDDRPPQYAVYNDCIYHHRRPPAKKAPERNLRIIQSYIEKQDAEGLPPDPRMVVYLGSELMAQGRHKEAIPAFHRYISMSSWDEEKYQAHHKLADCYRAVGMHEDAIVTELKGLHVRDDWADGYFGLAECYYHLKDWQRVLRWSDRGFALGAPKTLLITHPLDYSYSPKVMYAIALFNLGRVEEALRVTEEALALVPHDPNLAHNKKSFQELLRSQKTVESAIHLASELVVHDEPLKALAVLDKLPHTIQHHPQILDARQKTRGLVPMATDDVAYREWYAHNAFFALPTEDQSERIASVPRFRLLLEEVQSISTYPDQPGAGTRGLRILDVGCNDGLMATELAKLGHTVVGLDVNPAAISHCRERAEELGVSDSCTFVQGTVHDFPSTDQFDVVYAFEVIEHVLDVGSFLGDAQCHLKPGGRLIISTPDGVADRDGTEALGLAPRQHLRVLPRHTLSEMMHSHRHRAEVLTNVHTEDGLLYLSARPYQPGEKPLRHIDIWCPFTYEEWGPQTVAGGIGGSEEAVVHLARELYALGHTVSVYGATEGAYDGVLYHNHDKFDPYMPHDVVIIWRTPTPVDYRIRADEVYIWMHDIPVAADFTEERLERINGIFVLSDWHRDCLPNVPEDKVIRSRNGVNLLSRPEAPRVAHKVVWGSSPDRGLDKLLEVWGDVLEAVPDAELHCYYGFDMYDKLNRPPGFKNHVMGLVEKYEGSVHWHGRVGERELWDAYSTAAIWAYPTYFDEISCITAMRAQVTGAWPVVVPKAALMETIQYGTKVDVADINDPTSLAQFKDALITELTAPVLEPIRDEMMGWASDYYSWVSVAETWSSVFEGAQVLA